MATSIGKVGNGLSPGNGARRNGKIPKPTAFGSLPVKLLQRLAESPASNSTTTPPEPQANKGGGLWARVRDWFASIGNSPAVSEEAPDVAQERCRVEAMAREECDAAIFDALFGRDAQVERIRTMLDHFWHPVRRATEAQQILRTLNGNPNRESALNVMCQRAAKQCVTTVTDLLQKDAKADEAEDCKCQRASRIEQARQTLVLLQRCARIDEADKPQLEQARQTLTTALEDMLIGEEEAWWTGFQEAGRHVFAIETLRQHLNEQAMAPQPALAQSG